MVGDLACDAAGAISISMVRCEGLLFRLPSHFHDCTTSCPDVPDRGT